VGERQAANANPVIGYVSSGQKGRSPNLIDRLRQLADQSRHRYLFLAVGMVYLKQRKGVAI
jgi:hypothetical protein